MKKSTRVLALLLCLVMVAALMPTFAMAADEYKLVDPKNTLNQSIITLSKDRYTVKVGSEISYTDTGYGYETTYMFPQGKGGTAYEFNIHRTQDGTGKETDLNRWWRWAKDGDVLNQRQSDSAAGYNNATPGVDGWTAKVVYRDDGDADGRLKGDEQPVPRDGSRSQEYILMKPLLSPQPYCFIWTGGNRTRSANVIVKIDTTKAVGTSAILWSANGTDSKHFGNFLKTHEIETNRRVHYGDLGQNYMVIVEAKYVYYDLDGGNINGDASNLMYPCWTTGTAKTSQKHIVIQAPTKEGYSFQGWWCEELGKYVQPGTDLNNGITKDMHIVAHWKEIVIAPNYYVSFNGNGNTNADGTPSTYKMPNQGFHFNTPAELDNNQYIRQFVVTYDANKGVSPETSAIAEAQFVGWEDRGDLNGYSYTQFDAPFYANTYGDLYAAFGYDKVDLLNHYINNGMSEGRQVTGSPRGTYPNQATVSDLTNAEGAVVPLYAQWNDGSVILPTPEREVDPNEDNNILAWRFDGWYTAASGGSLVGMGGASYTPTGNTTLYAHWTAIKNTKYYVVHVTNGVAGTPVEYNTDNGNINFTNIVTSGYLYGGTFTEEACLNIATNNPTNFEATPGHTYYIWEVSKEHLVPKNISVWSKQDGITDVKAVYLLTAVDRLNYSAAGFQITSGEAKQVSTEGKIAYEYITVWQNNKDYTYYDLYKNTDPSPATTNGSLIQCCALTGFTSQDIAVVPYWVTLDGVKVFGTTQRTIHYKGSGTGTAYQSVDVNDTPYDGTLTVKSDTPVQSFAPMMLMARYSMANEENFVDVGNLPDEPEVPETAVVNVVDGENAYEAEIVDGAVALTPAGADGKLFAGWFADAAFTAPADLAAVNDGDTVYAKYVSANFLQVKYAAVFTLFNKSVSLTAAVADKNFAETGFVIETKNGTDTVVVSSYAAKFALQNAQQLFGVAKGAPLMSVDYKLSGLSKGDTITVTPYWVTADGTTVYGTARTLTYTGLTVKG